jgi:hypothetical protein
MKQDEVINGTNRHVLGYKKLDFFLNIDSTIDRHSTHLVVLLYGTGVQFDIAPISCNLNFFFFVQPL